MKILSFDPGYGRLGTAALEKSGSGKETLLHSSCFITDKSLPAEERLHLVATEVARLIDEHAPGAIALEKLFFSKNQKTAIRVAEARGVILERAAAKKIPVFEYGPGEIKTAITGYGKSDKAQVTDMVKRILRFEKPGALDDEYDAIAVGLTCFAYEKFR